MNYIRCRSWWLRYLFLLMCLSCILAYLKIYRGHITDGQINTVSDCARLGKLKLIQLSRSVIGITAVKCMSTMVGVKVSITDMNTSLQLFVIIGGWFQDNCHNFGTWYWWLLFWMWTFICVLSAIPDWVPSKAHLQHMWTVLNTSSTVAPLSLVYIIMSQMCLW